MPLTFARHHDVKSFYDSALALIPATITAGAGNDNVEVAGPAFDRQTAGREFARTCVLVIYGVATIAAGQSLTITANVQDDTASAFNGTPAQVGDVLPVTTVLSGAQTNGKFRVEHGVDLHPARRYIRARVTANLTATGTDTVSLTAVFILGGQQQYPA